MKKCLFLILIMSCYGIIYAQTDIPVGTWRTHNSFNRLIALTQSESEIFAAAKSAVFSYNPSSKEIEKYTNLTGLSDADITAIGYNARTAHLIITYRNGNIDLINEGKIDNFKDLLLSSIPDSKSVNHINSYNEYSYLSTDFGVMILDLNKMEVKDSYFELGEQGEVLKINSSVILGDSLFLATATGIIRGNLSDNLKDYTKWLRYDATDGLPQTTAKVILETADGLLAAFDSDGLFEFDGQQWQKKSLIEGEEFLNGTHSENSSLLTTTSGVYKYENSGLTLVNSSLALAPVASINYNTEVIIADGLNGLVFSNTVTNIYPNGPFDENVIKLYTYLDKVIALPPAYNQAFQPYRGKSGFFMFTDGEWLNYNSTGYPFTSMIPEFLDITDAMYSYYSNKLFLSSFGYGILELDDESTKIFDESNSSLKNLNSAGRNVFVTGLNANSTGLSAINFNSPDPLHFYNLSEDSWQAHMVNYPASGAVQIISFNNNTFWMRVPNSLGGGIKIYDIENNRELYLDDDFLPSNGVNDMIVDREGKMWVATDQGVVYFFNAENILDAGIIDPVQPIYEGSLLFRNEKIGSLEVDGGNRIWLSTSTGLWLFANDGQELISNFEASSSPLPSNNIVDLAINQNNGELFIATTNGLVSFRGTATAAGKSDPLKIFPNPVITSKNDVVTIEGVPTDADLWITDSSGRLVYRTTANGNTATWSGLSMNSGLSSGVYFVFVATKDGEEKQVGKIALIN